MQDWVLEQGSKIVCQIALKRRIQHIHSSHFLVFQISNGWSLWKVASANMQYLLFKGIWHWFFFFFPYLKPPESPRNSPLLSQSLSIMRRGGGRGGWGMEVSPSQGLGWSSVPSWHPDCGGSFIAGPRHRELVLGGFVWVHCRKPRRKIQLTVTERLKQPWFVPLAMGGVAETLWKENLCAERQCKPEGGMGNCGPVWVKEEW